MPAGFQIVQAIEDDLEAPEEVHSILLLLYVCLRIRPSVAALQLNM